MDVYGIGQEEALQSLGITKVAWKAPLMKRMGRWLLKKAPTWKGTREFAIGTPVQFGKEIMRGKALSKGSLMRQSLHAPDMFSKAMFYGFPAVEAGGIMLDSEANKARRVGEALGGATLGLAAYRPLGMLGSIGADMLGRSIGGGIGQTGGYLGDKIKGLVN